MAIFNSKINDYGFSDDHNYSKDYWISQDTFYIFGVEEEFPKITVEDIDRKFLSRVNYELSLTDLEGFSIDNIDEFLRI